MKGFDDYVENKDGDYPSARQAYKAGAASRQAEIDELQKRIDEALTYLRHIDSRGYGESVLSKILKGK